jgi:hypothetical protein
MRSPSLLESKTSRNSSILCCLREGGDVENNISCVLTWFRDVLFMKPHALRREGAIEGERNRQRLMTKRERVGVIHVVWSLVVCRHQTTGYLNQSLNLHLSLLPARLSLPKATTVTMFYSFFKFNIIVFRLFSIVLLNVCLFIPCVTLLFVSHCFALS